MESKSFANLPLSVQMQENLAKLGYDVMTPIQEVALPLVLKRRDVLAKAKTGSGKTAAFGIGVLQKLDVKHFAVQVLVLCPTRELSEQVAKELKMIAKFKHNIKIITLIGGESYKKQSHSLSHGAHIVVATPGRALQHLQNASLQLDSLQTLVLDEADRMLDMGFIEEVQKVVKFTPKTKQTLLFSATYNDEILRISKQLQNDALHVTIEDEVKNEIEEVVYTGDDKFTLLHQTLGAYQPERSIVFVATKLQADEIANRLYELGVDALALHGDLQQYERRDVLIQFQNHSCRVLVATDVAARGLDIKKLDLVVNFDLPRSKQDYIHRIGRTARAGQKGIAVTLCEPCENQNELCQELLVFQKELHCKKEAIELHAPFATLVIEGGKKDKLRAGDIVGALTSGKTLTPDAIGSIDIFEFQTYVAIKTNELTKAYKKLKHDTMKKKKFSIWRLGDGV